MIFYQVTVNIKFDYTSQIAIGAETWNSELISNFKIIYY